MNDAINPGLDAPTPHEEIEALTRQEREERVRNLMVQSDDLIRLALDTHLDDRELVARCLLFSGGNDSTVLGHLLKDKVDYAIHANTTIGIEDTRVFVRDTCKAWGLPLIEETAPTSYRELVLDQGFPGPGMHYKMYQRLKERPLRQARRSLVKNGRKQRVLFIAGRRRTESARRAQIPLNERENSVIWASPIANWTAIDMSTYRMMFDVPENPVSARIHMSGECLCGSFAKKNELEEIGYWYPETRAEIEELQEAVRAAGFTGNKGCWGHGQGRASKSGALCSSCDLRHEEGRGLD